MFKVALLVWIMLGTTLAGIAVVVIVSIPDLFDQGMKLIPIGGIGGYVLAIPFSFMIAKQLTTAFKR
jgi:hypothetical protein